MRIWAMIPEGSATAARCAGAMTPSRMRAHGLSSLLFLLAACQTPTSSAVGPHRVTCALGALWTHDLQAPRTAVTEAAVDPWAFAWQLGYEHVPDGQDGSVVWGYGLDVSQAIGDVDSERTGAGWFASEEGGSMSLLRITPGVTARFPLDDEVPAASFLTASAGLGYYGLDVEADQFSPLFLAYGTRTILEDECLGAFLGLGYESIEPGRGGFFVEAEAHFVDFETGSDYPPGTGSIRGPMVSLWIGFIASF